MALNLRRRSLGNSLIRRVQRHVALSTLFRSPVERSLVQDSLGRESHAGQPAPAGATVRNPVVRASLLTVNQQDELAAANELPIQSSRQPQPPQASQPEPAIAQAGTLAAPPAAEPPKARSSFLQRAAAALGLRPKDASPDPAIPPAVTRPGPGLPPQPVSGQAPENPSSAVSRPVIPSTSTPAPRVQAARDSAPPAASIPTSAAVPVQPPAAVSMPPPAAVSTPPPAVAASRGIWRSASTSLVIPG
jgi:hypothetical protein